MSRDLSIDGDAGRRRPADAAQGQSAGTAAEPWTVPAAFERSAQRYPERIAIEFGERAFAYRELRALAGSVRALLPQRQLGEEVARVALLFDDRIAALAATLGALAGGHAFVPLDASDPEERIRLILADSEPLALLSEGAHLDRARRLAPAGCAVVDLAEAENRAPLTATAESLPDDLAYLFYTSGSTGQPKGVCQTHRNLLYFVRAYCSKLGIGGEDRLSLLYSLSFSAANMDIFGGLLNGATISAYDMRQSGIPGLADWLDARRITILHAVPTVFRKLADSLEPQRRLGSVRAIDLGGESVTTSDGDIVRRHFRAGCRLVNHLAATEASVIAQHTVDLNGAYADGMLPVGHCPDQVEVRIERPDGGKAPAGEAGRILVASPYLSPGYWRRPDLNAAVFASDPDRPGWRVLRSEDLGSIDAEGRLYFHGREGTRVKIRGQSVDLGEVEAALRRCTGIGDAAVVAGRREAGPEADLLVAHIVTADPADRDARRLRRELADYLPHHMIPSAFAFPDSLPTMATGKIDRRALEAMALPAPAQDEPPATASDALEADIAELFALILNRDSVGREEDFYILGGDSFSSVELHIGLSEIAGGPVPLRLTLEDPSVCGLAAAIRRLRAETTSATRQSRILVPLHGAGHRPTLFLVHGKLGHAHVSPRFLGLLGRDQPVYAIQARGSDGADPPNFTIAAMAQDYLEAIRTIRPQGPYLLGGLCAGGFVALEMARILRQAGESVLPLLLIDPPPPPFVRTGAPDDVSPYALSAPALAPRHLRREPTKEQKNQRARLMGRRFKVAMAFESALLEMQPQAYEGEVCLFTSAAHRSPAGWGDPAKLRGFFAGPLQIFESAAKHDQILDAQGEEFSRQVATCLSHVRREPAAAQPSHGQP
jgi:amino acid adenylation domain-containing protein